MKFGHQRAMNERKTKGREGRKGSRLNSCTRIRFHFLSLYKSRINWADFDAELQLCNIATKADKSCK